MLGNVHRALSRNDSEIAMTTTIDTFAVPALNLADLIKRLDKLARKANKYGNNPIGYTIGKEYPKDTTIYIDNRPRNITTTFVDIVVWGDAPKYGDHRFLARVELRDGENIVNNIAGTELNERFRHMVSECDHCGHNRVRNDVYVFENSNGDQLAIGRTCLRDFTGCDNPLEIAGRAGFLAEIKTAVNDELTFAGYGSDYYNTKTVLQYAAANIRESGWVSKAMAMNSYDETIVTTENRVFHDLKPNAKHRPITVTEADIAMAETVMNHFRTMEYNPENGDYINNLRVIIGDDLIKTKHLAIAVSAVNVIVRDRAKQIENNNAATVSDYFGTIGTRYRGIELTVNREIAMGDRGYGEQYLYNFTDNTGNQFTWFTGKKYIETGEKLTVDFTVKAHREYNNIKQTNITRATIKE
jgi:hypothetical protein